MKLWKIYTHDVGFHILNGRLYYKTFHSVSEWEKILYARNTQGAAHENSISIKDIRMGIWFNNSEITSIQRGFISAHVDTENIERVSHSFHQRAYPTRSTTPPLRMPYGVIYNCARLPNVFAFRILKLRAPLRFKHFCTIAIMMEKVYQLGLISRNNFFHTSILYFGMKSNIYETRTESNKIC